jgi:hypothetical protein
VYMYGPKAMDGPGISRAGCRGGVPELGLEQVAPGIVKTTRIVGSRVVAAQRSVRGASDGSSCGNAHEGCADKYRPSHGTLRRELFTMVT